MKKQNKQNAPQQGRSSGSGKTSLLVKESGGEPVASRTAMPVLLIALLVGLIYWGNMYVVEYGGKLDARVQGPYRSFKELESLKPQDESARLSAQGAKVYNQFCSGCHMGDGNGNASSGFPPLAGSEWVLEKDPSRIIRIVLNGVGGPMTVKGKEYGQAQMLPWRDALKDEDIAAVLTYVRNTWGNKGPAVDAALVKQIRDQTADKGGPWTAADLLKVPLKN
jgi:mono/diheme cytochrome c family protein